MADAGHGVPRRVFAPHRSSFTILLLSNDGPHDARAYGGEIHPSEAELRWAILRPWLWPAALGVVGMFGAFVLSIFSDNSAVDNVADFVDWVRHIGIWQWALVLSAVTSARRLSRWMFAYSALDLANTLHTALASPQTPGEFEQPRVA